ncbi:MAG TPA: 4-(cytidine 5'-diphospho)-2-C-methyl-D-erythritol kinase [Actinomycetota bacterium]|nr:4-(cytidine 5'-diphospho)-2-C-methyl-D-erythritol kinase [Actinomycetota bacterium]
MSAEPIARRAHAKINVFLRVLGRREDGFHDLESVVLPLSLHDLVTVSPDGGSDPSVTVEGIPELTGRVPTGEDNLVIAAVRELSKRSGVPGGFRVDIHKRIPVAAGLGGGSTDAAATLLALAEHLAEVDGGHGDPSTLMSVATELGSDVPALLAGGPMLVSGRGEVLTPVHTVTTWWVLKPFDVAVTAADAYAWWDHDPATGPDPGVLIAALETGDLALLGSALFNDLQAPVVARHPEVGEAIEALMEAGALGAVMSGSGPTVAALASHMGHADRLAEAVGGAIVVSGPPA